MVSKEFIQECIKIVRQYVDEHIDKVTPYVVHVVWQSKVLQNNKALLSTSLPDGMYYELTHNGDTGEIYLDAYKKFENRTIKIGEN